MSLKQLVVTFGTLGMVSFLQAQVPQNGLDVQHYRFSVEINDSSDLVRCDAIVVIKFLKDVNEVVLDLVQQDETGKGMKVLSITKNNRAISFSHNDQHLTIADAGLKDIEGVYRIVYEGVPADGLIISKNRYGNRTFFCDHWPSRAHHWLPCNDHPSDKASVEFVVTAPEHYQVVANGLQLEETALPGHLKLTHWKEEVPLPVKVMAMGAADFAVHFPGYIDCIPITNWVFPEDKKPGFDGYAKATEILPYLIEKIGAYPYRKLANVQSKTRFGALENASVVFYSESSVNDKGIEALLAHEIAHQWFGNSATETDWPHLWLSEGFVTYMEHLYHENKYGADSLASLMQKDREAIIAFARTEDIPVVDTVSPVDPMALLNANSYQKGGWVLHMLRRKIGDSLFWKGLSTYYATYAGRNASTADLQRVFETVSRQDLSQFFKQWLYTAGHPILNITWEYNNAKKMVTIKVEQTQPQAFDFPLEIAFTGAGETALKILQVKEKAVTKEIPLAFVPTSITLDPNVNLLFEAKIRTY